jgi:hypothetical protein
MPVPNEYAIRQRSTLLIRLLERNMRPGGSLKQKHPPTLDTMSGVRKQNRPTASLQRTPTTSAPEGLNTQLHSEQPKP